MTLWSAFLSLAQGVVGLNPWASATAVRTRWKYSPLGPAHGATAPSSMVRSGLGTTSSGSTSYRVPRPSHLGHAPYGELNEKLRGASSSKDVPSFGHARCWLKVRI